jgi:acyl carrier protein phosphodiesterase
MASLYGEFLEGLKGYPSEVVELQRMLRRVDAEVENFNILMEAKAREVLESKQRQSEMEEKIAKVDELAAPLYEGETRAVNKLSSGK